ncbi:electron transport complex protein RnfG [Caminicella sporogenes DSM 14501]|uniref:Ion-translocating oxidoreductase complex subunit G n=1 Tax=Caminicella sporogenes DSM 14501 TaxID=1121266 RepID=A0A1M6LX26_9FIRM|nr:RnfABCDGE type electron transport complex subunit G [Caminicella sporogenes]RKD27985.1 electron transporter RnfG [Caminicella sporogenes]SHJ75817.1 electron transport complex protein RnfG [Caminicella sporogenes DSM 14501]
MKEIVKLGLILLLICAVSALALSFTYDLSKDQILAQREAANNKARKNVLPDAENFKPVSEEKFKEVVSQNDKVVEIYAGYKGEEIIGYAIKTLPSGYGGAVEVMTGIGMDGKIKGVRIGNHQETPGLGANATLPSFYTQYEGKSIEKELKVTKSGQPKDNEIQAISGATITSRAVTSGVNYAVEAFKLVAGK